MRRRAVMAVSSGGGHWVELRRLLPAFEGLDVVYVSTDEASEAELAGAPYHRIPNVSRMNARGAFGLLAVMARVVRAERPEVVITTGAFPGFVALLLAKLLVGSRTVWIDSIAAGERMSLSGRLARPVADAWLVQWPHLARPGGPEHWGAVL